MSKWRISDLLLNPVHLNAEAIPSPWSSFVCLLHFVFLPCNPRCALGSCAERSRWGRSITSWCLSRGGWLPPPALLKPKEKNSLSFKQKDGYIWGNTSIKVKDKKEKNVQTIRRLPTQMSVSCTATLPLVEWRDWKRWLQSCCCFNNTTTSPAVKKSNTAFILIGLIRLHSHCE